MTPLESLHRRNGARFASYGGVEAPADFGSVDDEHRALCESCGIFDRSRVSGLSMTGADRVRFLNGLVTCDVAELSPGEWTYGFFTQVKGRILADVRVFALADELRLELPAEKCDEIAQHLGKYVIFDQVEIGLWEAAAISLIGPDAASVLVASGTVGELPDKVRTQAQVELFGVPVLLVRDASYEDVPVWTAWSAAESSSVLWEELLETEGTSAVGREAWERLRVEAGCPLFGQDFGIDNFPQETGLEDAVSYTKGCYLGQEVVARIHYRGGVNKELRGLRFEDAGDPLGDALVSGGQESGTVTSAVRSPSLGHVGLAVVHHRVESGETVELSGGGRAEVVTLPFER